MLEYSFPDIGTIVATLHKESAHLYNYLKEINEVERLEHLDHLGELRAIHKSAHYSRWEYIMLQLFFVDTLKEAEATWGLAQSVDVANFKISSGEELVKCWALLLNFSHLKGIFDAERVWLELFLTDQQLRQTFLGSIRSSVSKEGARKMFEAENVYGLHKYIGLSLLYYLKKVNKKKKLPWDLWIALLEGYLAPTSMGSKLGVCKSIFERIRKLVFIALDLNHCPLGIRMNTSLLLSRIKLNPAELLYDQDSPFIRHIDALERMLFQNVYAEPKIVQYRLDYLTEQKKKYSMLVKRETQKALRTSQKRLCQRLRHAHSDNFGKIKRDATLTHYLRLELLPDEILPREPVKYYSEQGWLANRTNMSNWHFMITPVAFANGSGCVIDVFNSESRKLREEIVIVWSLLKYIPRYFGEYKRYGLFDLATARYTEQLFQHVLRRLLKSGYTFRFERHSSPSDQNVSFLTSASEIAIWRKSFRDDIADSKLPKDRKLELRKLRELIRRERKGAFLICCSRVRIFDSELRSIAEFDGMYIHVLKHLIEVVLVEVKKGITRKSEKARKALRDGLEASLEAGTLPHIIKRKETAYAIVDFATTLSKIK